MAKYGALNILLEGTILLQQGINQQKLSRCTGLCSAVVKRVISVLIDRC